MLALWRDCGNSCTLNYVVPAVKEAIMPAIHVDDLTVLPRVATSTKQPREVMSITTAPRGFEGEGSPSGAHSPVSPGIDRPVHPHGSDG